jgi:hypothetical protein
MRVVYTRLPAREICNGCDPGLFFDLATELKDTWWNEKYDPLRVLLRQWYIDLFDEATGHYTNLRKSIVKHGVQDPIIVTAGPPMRRAAWMLPPDCGQYVCETIGGSRLLFAQELDLEVPCIVNDQIGIDGEELFTADEVLERFVSKTLTITYGPPVVVSFTAFSHMDKDYTMRSQVLKRRAINIIMAERAHDWLKKNK